MPLASLRVARTDNQITVESNRRTLGLSLEMAIELRDALTLVLETDKHDFRNETYILLATPSRPKFEGQPSPNLADLLGF